MTSTRNVLKNLIPTEIPVLPPDVKLSELKTSEGRKKVSDKFNQLHIDFYAKVILIQNTLHIMSLDVINIIIDYFAVDHLLLVKYENYRKQGIKDIAHDQFIMLNEKGYYPLLLSYDPAGICFEEVKKEFSPDEFKDSKDISSKQFIATYSDSNDNIRYRGVFAVYKDQLGYRVYERACYPEGMIVIDDATHITMVVFEVSRMDTQYKWTRDLTVIKIPPNCVAKTRIQNLTFQLTPYDYCDYRVFNGANVHSETKVWKQRTYLVSNTSIFTYIRSLFGCKRKQAKDLQPEIISQAPTPNS